MRKKGQSWFLPLLVLFVVIWAIGKKDSPKTEPPAIQASVNTLASNSSPAPQPTQASAPEHFVKADKLNLRAEPGGKVISSLKRGEKVQPMSKKRNGRASASTANHNGGSPTKISAAARTALSPRGPNGSALLRSQFEAQHPNMDHRAPAPLVVYA
ncbi:MULTISPECIES: hypothetical protein [Pseudomonas]|uniref:hypothetical protein n=1 Tax=Pseudomonas TaxID=286 RepID=UPI001F399211|nr:MULTISPECIES: hypothetical protein [Pseudomonas]MDH0132907.1 hypothetical protein [Pseudomonas asiatica]MDM9588942.1 hypothetical protein [Pseudomonas asiatica]WDM86693.1 hypothetical protein LG197_18970 [Pseudomonas asiatica]WJM56156.1 hypothetical protein QUC26_13855 [Pseudomonas asiatica]WOB61516.1 hypothetical protein NY023_14040 [Pseudomonas sp. NBB]